MRYFLIVLCVFFFSIAQANEALKRELIHMSAIDQKVRREIQESGWENSSKALLLKIQEIDENNTNRLKVIIKEHSWLTSDLVGKEGMAAVFLIVQHSPDLEFKAQMLPYLKISYLKGEGVTGQEVALLTDRVLIEKGYKQLYGTQVDISAGKVIIKPIEDETNVDTRRAEMQMPPLAFYLKLMEEMYGITDHPEIELNQ
ncbi:DUF6624 domain-containing protein [uncultured Shewanella sp.]|uniref:DUF6624 domain-containing protein n=1 Tax=uncultured Shewanella sp. TaxID=173975 RepID=UPI002619978D|nr:DUF6624 domain-containing protein [uncultured Shewanella sp.]